MRRQTLNTSNTQETLLSTNQALKIPWLVKWKFLQPVISVAVSAGRDENEAVSGILATFDGADGLEIIDVHPATEEEIEDLGDDADVKIKNMIELAYKQEKQLN